MLRKDVERHERRDCNEVPANCDFQAVGCSHDKVIVYWKGAKVLLTRVLSPTPHTNSRRRAFARNVESVFIA